jgi:hypothetical protein
MEDIERLRNLCRDTVRDPIMVLASQCYTLADALVEGGCSSEKFTTIFNEICVHYESDDGGIDLLVYDDHDGDFYNTTIKHIDFVDIHPDTTVTTNGFPRIFMHSNTRQDMEKLGDANTVYEMYEDTVIPLIQNGWMELLKYDGVMPYTMLSPYDICAAVNMIELTIRFSYWIRFIYGLSKYNEVGRLIMTSGELDGTVVDKYTLLSMGLFTTMTMNALAGSGRLPNDPDGLKVYIVRGIINLHPHRLSEDVMNIVTGTGYELSPDEAKDLRYLDFSELPDVQYDMLTSALDFRSGFK